MSYQALRFARSIAFAFISVVFAFTLLGASQARAQTVDWVLNLSDAGSDPTPAGGTINYAITITNNGFGNAPATTVNLTVPANTTFTGGTGTITGCTPTPRTGPGTITCNVPALASSASANLNAAVLTTISQTVFFRAVVPETGDDLPGNSDVTETTTVSPGADLALTLAGPPSAAAGSIISYTFTATNNGPDPATNKVVNFPVPSGIANVVPPSGCTLSGSTYSCTIPGPIASGSSASLVFQGQISAGFGSTVTAVGDIAGGSPPDPISGNNTTNLNTAVTAGSDLTIGKSRAPSGTLLVGDAVTFTLAGRYSGDSPTNLIITDTLPANYSVGAITAPGWLCTVTGQTVECRRSSGTGPGANVPLGPITVNATAISAGSATNTADIIAAGPVDPNPANNSDDDGGATINPPVVDLEARKTGPVPQLVVVGQPYNFNIGTANVGNAAFYGTAVLTDNLPAGLRFDAFSGAGWTCLPAAPVAGPAAITCERIYTQASPLAAGTATPVVTIQTTVLSAGPINNAMTVSSPDANIADLNPANDTITYGVTGSTGANSADISVVKTAAIASLAVGDVQTFTLQITNAGPQPSQNITLTDDLINLMNSAEGASDSGFISASISPGSASGVTCSTSATGGTSRRLSCTIANLPVCSAASCPTVTVQIRPGGEAGARNNTARAISSVTADPNLGNNDGAAPYSVTARADVTVAKSASPASAIAGQNITYVLTAQNVSNGLSSANAVTVSDTLPANMTFVSASPSSGSCTTQPAAGSTTGSGNDSVVCNLGTIPNGSQQTVTIIARPKFATRGTTLTNNVVISTSTAETDTTNNTAFAATPIAVPAVELIINKDDSVDPLAVSDNTVYTVTVTNIGPSAAENVMVTDNMPAAGISYQSHTVATGGTCGTVPIVGSFGGTLVCNFPVIPAGQTRTVTVTGQGASKGIHRNNASVTSDETIAGFESNTGNNAGFEDTTVRTRADVQVVSKVATPGTVNLLDPFTYVIRVRNNTGVGFAEADNVVVSDNLPANMQLTGAPTAGVISGTASVTTCTGASGGTTFSCNLGTMSNPAVVDITLPVRVIAITSSPQTFNNTASVVTSSFDPIPANNSNSGPVDVLGSSIAGRVFRDFANDAGFNGSDTGIGSLVMTLTGTGSDGVTAINRTVNTAPDGTYTFANLPEGTYSISQGAISETSLSNGTTTAGTSSGTAAPTAITAIALADNTNATGYLFPKIPQARIAIAKNLQAGPVINPDGTFNVTFRLNVRNLSLEALTNVAVSDTLSGASPRFGTYVSIGAPTTGPLAAGEYTMLAAPSGSCGGLNSGFNGSADTNLASSFGIAATTTCTIDVQLRVQPTSPLPPLLAGGARYFNQASVTGDGALSGQTSATNPQLSDLSDNGTNPDPNGNGLGNETGENDPTPVTINQAPAIRLVKSLVSVNDTTGDTLIGAGDTAAYSFAVTNTGSLALASVTVTDPLVTVVGSPISLAIGATNTTAFTASYVLTQVDVDRGYVDNTATTVGNAVTSSGTQIVDGSGNPVTTTDVSDTGTAPGGAVVSNTAGTENASGSGATDADPTNDPTVAVLAPLPRIVLTKSLTGVTDTVADGQTGAGDTVAYTFAVTNTGTVALGNVTVTDPLVVETGRPISLAIGATNSAAFTATYVLTQADIDRGYVNNTATANGTAVTSTGTAIVDGAGNPVTTTDLSDTGTAADRSTVAFPATTETPDGEGATDANPGNDPTPLVIAPTPRIVLIKSVVTVADTNSNGLRDVGDIASYRFAVTNTGTVRLAGIIVTDPLVTVVGGPVALNPGEVNGTAFTATYTLTQADVDRGYVDNTATTIGNAVTSSGTPILNGSGNPVTTSDISDTGTAPDGSTVAAPATTENASGSGVTDTDPTNDITVLRLTPQPAIRLVKSITSVTDTTGDTLIGAGDTVAYSFAVTNTGSLALAGVTVTDPLVTVVGTPVSLAIGATNTTAFTASYVLTQADIDRGYVDNTATTVGNAVTSSGTPILDGSGNPVTTTDVSDTGTAPDAAATPVAAPATTESPSGSGATDADPTNDPTVAVLAPQPRIVLTKSLTGVTDTVADGQTGAGDTVAYTFAVTNTGTVALGNVTVADPLVVETGGPVSLAIGATNTSAFTATYVLTQADIDRGYVNNTATATGTAVTTAGTPILDGSGNPVTTTDTSDTGTAADRSTVATPATTETPDGAGATDANPGNDPTPLVIAPLSSIRLVKSYSRSTDTNGNGYVDAGDVLNFTFAVTNTGNLTLTNVTVSDPIAVLAGGPIPLLAPGAIDTATFTATYVLTDADIDRTYFENTATTTGAVTTIDGTPILDGSGNPLTVSDVSDTGTDPDANAIADPAATETPNAEDVTDGNPTNDPTVVQLGRPQIALDIQVAGITDINGNGITDAGDEIIYTFILTNTGNIPLVDANIDPSTISLPLVGLVCQPISMAVGETATLVCTGNRHVITAEDVAAGTVTLGGDARGTSEAGQVVTAADAVVSIPLGLGGLGITKTVDRSRVSVGDVVTYTITVTNSSATLTTITNIFDRLPAGFIYETGTARVAGAALEPQANGRTLTWTNVSLAPRGSVIVTLNVRIGSGVQAGDHDNVARAVSPLTGRAVTPDAIATVRIAVDPVFSCSTVIGRVFDDRNQDGYFNGEPREEKLDLTDYTEKMPTSMMQSAQSKDVREKGLPGVRLITPNGLAITTDGYGRFSVPCAALPASGIGSNFMLKLDTRTLPSGYRVTTENPRVVRVTQGMLTKMNFGAAISRVVRVDISAKAFGQGDAARRPVQQLVDGLDKMVADIASTPSTLRFTYQLGKGESEKLARQRLREVEKIIRKLWPDQGRYQLNVETHVQRRPASKVTK